MIARNTAFTYKGKPVDAKAIGKEFGVRYVLEGSVQPGSNQARVNAQLIDADSGAHVWADQFDIAHADLLQTQDEIVTRLGRAMEVQLTEAEAARLKRTPTANPDAEDLALQCEAGVQKGGYVGKEAEAAYRLCEQALAIDPDNVRALVWLGNKSFFSAAYGGRDLKGDINRADQLVSKALALDPNYARAHLQKAFVLTRQERLDESIAECERALALDPSMVSAIAYLAFNYLALGQFEKSLEYYDKAFRLSPHDPSQAGWHQGKAAAYIGLKQYDQAIESDRRSIAISPDTSPWPYFDVIASLALSGHEAEARETLQRYLALVPSWPKTIAAFKAALAPFRGVRASPRILEAHDRAFEGLRKAGMPEQ